MSSQALHNRTKNSFAEILVIKSTDDVGIVRFSKSDVGMDSYKIKKISALER